MQPLEETGRSQRQLDEGGFAMIAALSVATVALALALITMALGVSVNESTTRDRRWHTALTVAESGVQHALREYGVVAANNPTPPSLLGPFTGSAAGGSYNAQIQRCTAAGAPAGCPATGWLIANSTGSVATNQGSQVQRRVRVSYGPDPVFSFALFSFGDLELKNNAVVNGDIFANGYIKIGQNAVVTGDIVSAQGWVQLENGARVNINGTTGRGGNVYSGGNNPSGNFGIDLANGTIVQADARARRQCTPAPSLPTTTERITGNGTINGSAYAPGAITANVNPARKFQVCLQRPDTSGLPPLRPWTDPDPTEVTHRRLLADYYCGLGVDPVAGACPNGYPFREFTSVAAFQAAVLDGTVPPGVYRVTDPGDATINMQGQMLSSSGSATQTDPNVNKLNDYVIRTTEKLTWGNGTDFYTGPGTALIEILSENTSPCQNTNQDPLPAINIENALSVNSTTATSTDPLIPQRPAILWYSAGCIDTKNNGEIPGAAYGSPLRIKNNANVGYDPRIRRTVGAGTSRFFQATWNEIRP